MLLLWWWQSGVVPVPDASYAGDHYRRSQAAKLSLESPLRHSEDGSRGPAADNK